MFQSAHSALCRRGLPSQTIAPPGVALALAASYYNLYGPTETNVCTFARIPTPIPEDRTEPYPIGWPCSHCAALVLDSDNLPVEAGAEGLLYIAGPSVFSGYWGRPQESAAVFIERDGTRWYNTGDVVKETENEGFLYAGRRDTHDQALEGLPDRTRRSGKLSLPASCDPRSWLWSPRATLDRVSGSSASWPYPRSPGLPSWK